MPETHPIARAAFEYIRAMDTQTHGSQTEIARRMGLTPGAISRQLGQGQWDPAISTLEQVAVSMGYDNGSKLLDHIRQYVPSEKASPVPGSALSRVGRMRAADVERLDEEDPHGAAQRTVIYAVAKELDLWGLVVEVSTMLLTELPEDAAFGIMAALREVRDREYTTGEQRDRAAKEIRAA